MITPIIIVDDHPLFRKGIEYLLANQSEIAIVEQYGDFNSIKNALESNKVNAQIVLLDRILGNHDGLSLIPLFKEKNIKIIMLSMLDGDFEIREAIQQGVDAYILKEAEPQQILQAILSVVQGNNLYPSAFMKKVLDSKSSLDPNFQKLSTREIEIIAYVAKGLSNRSIGEYLKLSENTVRNHLRSILDKLNLTNRVQVATFALKRGISKHISVPISKEFELKMKRSRHKKSTSDKKAE